MNKLSTSKLYLIILALIPFNQLHGTIQKNSQLNFYLDIISYNIQEKIGILPYILNDPSGTYLEIGTGGDPIATMLSQIPATSNTTLIASDIEQTILDALPNRHPELHKYLHANFGPKLQLKKLNAIDLSYFADQTLDGINASAILHEIISYASGFHGLDQFFNETLRVLKPNGMLIYRDPNGVNNPKQSVVLTLTDHHIKLFAHFFIFKFLDQTHTTLARSGRKFKLYRPDDLTFLVYLKDQNSPTSLSYLQYLQTPTHKIDFQRPYSLTLPHGLYRELARHYLTYLHQCSPLKCVKCTPNLSQDHFDINYFAHGTQALLQKFIQLHGDTLENNQLSQDQKDLLDLKVLQDTAIIETGLPLNHLTTNQLDALINLLDQHQFSTNLYLINLHLDYRVFNLLYDEICQTMDLNGLFTNNQIEPAKWSKREGEEFYFYLNNDELISRIIQNSALHIDSEVLCPLSPQHNFTVQRLCYTELLNSCMTLTDPYGYNLPIQDSKRIIHFSKIPLSQAILICESIISQNPNNYPELQQTILSLKQKFNLIK